MASAIASGAGAHDDRMPVVADGCYHCGEDLPARPARVELDGAGRAFWGGRRGGPAPWIRQAHRGANYPPPRAP
ncbi:MAG: hypothetical protein ACTH0Y_09225, partial [Luteimonas sp.]